MPIFASLGAPVIDSLAPLWELENLSSGAPIFEEGDSGDKFFILLQGKVVISKGGTVLGTLNGEGNAEAGHPFFGEMALLDGKARMAAAHASTACLLLVLQQHAFARFTTALPDFGGRLRAFKEMRARQSELNLQIASERSQTSQAVKNANVVVVVADALRRRGIGSPGSP